MRRVGVGLVALGVVMAGVGLWRLVEGYDAPPVQRDLAAAVRDAGRAHTPFRGLTETRVTVGGRALLVAVADNDSERGQGLRRRRDLGRYAGMLFAYGQPTTVGFTMSTVPVGLDIAFYDRHGDVVDRLHMKPCAGTDAECPVYRAAAPFQFALETLTGRLPRGRLAA